MDGDGPLLAREVEDGRVADWQIRGRELPVRFRDEVTDEQPFW